MLELLNKKPSTSASDDSADLLHILRLIRSENVGCKTFKSLIELYGSAVVALENIEELSLRGGRHKPITIYPKSKAEDEIARVKGYGAKLISYRSPEYPNILKQIDDYPPILTALGDLSLLQRTSVAIVGARNSSLNGKNYAAKIAQALGNNSYIVTSGLARGIDTASHIAALPSGTIAVIAGGIDHIYPPENRELYHAIAKKGLILAELPIGSNPLSSHFPQRNRIISGLSIATIVVEAGLKSGSLITARMALEQNRELFAVPGFAADPRHQGTNRLIKQGAYLVESIEDIINNLPDSTKYQLQFEENNAHYRSSTKKCDEDLLIEARKFLLENLSSCSINFDMLIDQSNIPAQVINVAILELELAGKIQRLPGNKFALIY